MIKNQPKQTRPEQVDGPLNLKIDGQPLTETPSKLPDGMDLHSADSGHPFGFDLNGVSEKVQKVLLFLLERNQVIEAKTAFMSIARPMSAPDEKNHNTDSVAGLP